MVTRTKKIFVGGLSAPTTLEDVKNYFEQFGRVGWKSFNLNFEIIFNFDLHIIYIIYLRGTFPLNVHVNLPIFASIFSLSINILCYWNGVLKLAYFVQYFVKTSRIIKQRSVYEPAFSELNSLQNTPDRPSLPILMP